MMKKPLLLAILCSLTVVAGLGLAAPALSDLEELGRHLYNEKGQASSNTESCTACHTQHRLLPG